MVNPSVDGYTKSPDGKSPKTKKDDNLLKTKRILKPKYGLVFTFSRPGESKSPLIPPASYSNATNTLNIN